MATHVSIADADGHLSELIAMVKQGKEVVIEDEDRTPIKLVVAKPQEQRVFGHARTARLLISYAIRFCSDELQGVLCLIVILEI